jgi:hypothetical protein
MTIYHLYIKTHNVTKLKYLGFTSNPNVFKYKGSGKRWLNHIKVHGYDVTTEILFSTEIKEEITTQGMYYSNLYNIVESVDWANLKPESGDSGLGHRHSNETKEKIRRASTGRPKSPETLDKQRRARIGMKFTDEHRATLSKVRKGRIPWNKGVAMTEEQKSKISNANKGRSRNKGVVRSEEHKQKISNANKGRIPWNKKDQS